MTVRSPGTRLVALITTVSSVVTKAEVGGEGAVKVWAKRRSAPAITLWAEAGTATSRSRSATRLSRRVMLGGKRSGGERSGGGRGSGRRGGGGRGGEGGGA